MKVLLNEQGYVESYALEGDLLDAVETEEPDDLSHFGEHFTAYQVRDGIMVFDDAQAAAEQAEAAKGAYRKRREVECFPVINRGQLWYPQGHYGTLHRRQQPLAQTLRGAG